MSGTLQVVVRNNTNTSALYAHITGTSDAGLFILSSDGQTAYHPASPTQTLSPLGADCAINVGGTGQTRTLTIPYVSGGRIWFSKDKPLTFFVNPGPALVEPSALNMSDANYNLDWGFAEFTFNRSELYVNVSFVDFVSLPVSLRLENASGKVTSVAGMPSDGLDRVCAGLTAQGQLDGAGWDKLVVRSAAGQLLRALSPNSGAVMVPGLLQGYYAQYVDAVWAKYAAEDLTVNTQFKWGDAKGRVNAAGLLDFGGDAGQFGKPSAVDIFSCNSGPFAHFSGVTDEALNIGARLAAALNRSTLLINSNQPEGEDVAKYYQDPITNHYARICHATSIEGRGYAFPYDDVGASKGVDQSGFLNDPNPKTLTIGIGAPLE
ncbi:glucan endo-1,3-beta-glucosidase precursor, putative [Cordyceps militaris CM01]|uniref:Glucan endo-1,3-beta-glucosidase, putative n=1 Tax=Cordyceps militaris (strain CM01) TaxID=983644 RepID=G3JH54_CORMM|nr:glucan endo-1,3-beta-glucosidase precursor, putative [Cordyceps militaris CM01]EGX91610.1 glucan endo-1,3-beta-glucosidase precursor, putative [Cordyceps militaris CM01]